MKIDPEIVECLSPVVARMLNLSRPLSEYSGELKTAYAVDLTQLIGGALTDLRRIAAAQERQAAALEEIANGIERGNTLRR